MTDAEYAINLMSRPLGTNSCICASQQRTPAKGVLAPNAQFPT